ncbi:MAG: GldG family protein [Ruminococcus sp.]|nr:GldG family protein [Ruminococcus sp.]
MADNSKNIEEQDTEEQVSTSSSDLLKKVLEEEKENKDLKEEKSKKPKKDRKPRDKTRAEFGAKKFRHGTMATVFTAVFIAVLVLINVVTTTLFERYPITVDLTRDKIYSMSEKSEEYVKNVDVDVLVTIFSDEDVYENYNAYNKQAVELLKNYCKLNHHITYRFVDIDKNPDVIRNYENVSAFDIIFETNTVVDGEKVQRTRKLGMLDLLSFRDEFVTQLSQSGYSIEMLAAQAGSDMTFLSYYGGYVDSSNAEQAFTSALMTVTDPNPLYVTFLTGRQEVADPITGGSPLTYFQTLLTSNGYNVDSIDITTQDIPETTDIIVIPAPTVDYLDNEVAKVSDFLKNGDMLGKQLIYIASYSQGATPNLDEFLEEYGLQVGPGVICETYKEQYINNEFNVIASSLSDDFDQDIQADKLTVVSMYNRPVNTLFDEKNMVTTEKYVMSSKDAYTAELGYNEMFQYVPVNTLERGEQCYFAVGSKARFANDGSGDTFYSNILCFGSEYLLQNNILAAEQYQNSEYFFSILNGITHKTDGIFIQPKTITGTAFDINEQQKTVLKWVFSAIIPAAVLVVGIVVWVRRKNK